MVANGICCSDLPSKLRVRSFFIAMRLLLGVLAGWIVSSLLELPGPAVLAAQGDQSTPSPAQAVRLIRVHLPLTGSADQTLQATLVRLRDQLLVEAQTARDARRPALLLLLDSPHTIDAQGDVRQFERVLAVAQFLCRREMAGVRTVAYIPHGLEGHGVLLALACEEIVMAPEATLGPANTEQPEGEPISETVISAYREIARTQRTVPEALALSMIDPQLELLQVEAETGTHFLLASELPQFTENQVVISQKVLVPAGTAAQFDGREGRQFGFVKYLAANRAALAQALDVTEASLQEDESLSDAWSPVVIDLGGEITPRTASRFETLLGQAVEQYRANWICIRIDSAGGDLESGLRIASAIARLDANSMRTVAYVPQEARGVAAVVALSCDYLAPHPSAQIASVLPTELTGGPVPRRRIPLAPDKPPLDRLQAKDPALAAAVDSIHHSLAPRTERTWSLLAAMIDPSIELATYQNTQTGQLRIMSSEELAEQRDADDWQLRDAVGADQAQLVFTGEQAHERGIASRLVDSFDELKLQFGIRGEVPVMQPNAALELIEALAAPELAIILLMVGFAGIYIELRTAGVGIGGFVGTVALLLFFWSKYLHGTAGWLEVLLFLAGFSFLLLEIFVLPGFGIFGIGGGAMILASLVLASLTFIRPHSEAEVDQLARSVGSVAVAGLGVMAFAMMSRRYLPQAPLFRSIVLSPPHDEELEELTERESVADYTRLLGRQGTATTDLRPAGKATIDHELVDVIAESEPLAQGTTIVVVEARGSRIVVRAAQRG